MIAGVLLVMLAASPLGDPWVDLGLEPALTGFRFPVFVGNAGDGSKRIFVVEQRGVVRVVQNGKLAARPFLDVSKLLGNDTGEQGLLGLAFHPKFKENGRVYIAYTDQDENDAVAELRASGDHSRVDEKTLQVLWSTQDFAGNHNGGMLAFGKDGFLYAGTGDGGGAGDPHRNGQEDTAKLGKMLRVDVDRPDVATLLNPLLVTTAELPLIPFTHVFRSVSVACLRALVIVQVIAVSAASIVSVLPLSALALPVHARVAV